MKKDEIKVGDLVRIIATERELGAIGIGPLSITWLKSPREVLEIAPGENARRRFYFRKHLWVYEDMVIRLGVARKEK